MRWRLCSSFWDTADGGTPETTALARLSLVVYNRVAGVGFDLGTYNANGASGTFRFHCTGV